MVPSPTRNNFDVNIKTGALQDIWLIAGTNLQCEMNVGRIGLAGPDLLATCTPMVPRVEMELGLRRYRLLEPIRGDRHVFIVRVGNADWYLQRNEDGVLSGLRRNQENSRAFTKMYFPGRSGRTMISSFALYMFDLVYSLCVSPER